MHLTDWKGEIGDDSSLDEDEDEDEEEREGSDEESDEDDEEKNDDYESVDDRKENKNKNKKEHKNNRERRERGERGGIREQMSLLRRKLEKSVYMSVQNEREEKERTEEESKDVEEKDEEKEEEKEKEKDEEKEEDIISAYTPTGRESLRAFHSRTSIFWNNQVINRWKKAKEVPGEESELIYLSSEPLSEKEIKRLAFGIAEKSMYFYL
eukprot:CAMPEP_0182424512 /NCGR_PEP_ID=MMETSP1167-20130531/10724_1 /TAXON_ID=2988 /ORGANISM="Mallomonas Sp, Strain CCMP3275" /LENGTH=209 /DNA_ID=CAMNT_0024604379 /DNA_START=217 /DNA_END=846 /DNA_ORIENTATION=-